MSQYAHSMKMPASTLSRLQRALSIALAAGLAAGVQAAGPDAQIRADQPAHSVDTITQPVLSGDIVVHVRDFDSFSQDLQTLQSRFPDLRLVRPLDADTGVYHLDAGSPEAAVSVSPALRALATVRRVQLNQSAVPAGRTGPVMHAGFTTPVAGNTSLQAPGIEIAPRPTTKDGVSTQGIAVDPLFGSQWHFINIAPAQRDNNIPASVYTSQGLSGTGVKVGFTNFGFNTHIDTDHTELDENYSFSLSTPFDPVLLPDNSVMTSLAGIVSGEMDGSGIMGVAPGSTVATYNWPGGALSNTFVEFQAYDWKRQQLDIKIFNTSGYVGRPIQGGNPGAPDGFVFTPLRNSFAFGRGGKGLVNIFSTGISQSAILPDPYGFPPANPGDSWSPFDALFQNTNELAVRQTTGGWSVGPFYAGAQVTNYPLANDRRSIILNTVAEDGFADVLGGSGPSVFASFYGGTTNQILSGNQGVSGRGVLTTVPGASNVGFFPAAGFVTGNESMTGPMIGAGVIALMLEVNPSLSIRDIQHILFQSIQESTKPANIKWPNFDINRNYIGFGFPPFDPSIPTYSFWQVNTGLYSGGTVENQAIRHSDLYGFGMVDAELAIQKAANWQGTPKLLLLDTGFVGNFNDPAIDSEDEIEIEIPDATFLVSVDADGAAGIDGAAAVIPGPFVPLPQFCVRQNVRIESVAIELTVTGAGAEDLYIVLESPNGTTSTLKLPATSNVVSGTSFDDVGDDDFDANTDIGINDTNYALYRHTFLTYKHWGELSGGQWNVFIADYGPDEANPEGEDATDDGMGGGDPGADMVISLGAFGLPGSAFREPKTVTGYRFMIYGTETGEPNFDGCPPAQTSCPGDLDGNGIVDIFDFFIYIQWFNEGNALADIDEDGDVDFDDLMAFRALWIPGFCDGDPNFGGRPRPGDSNAGGDNNPGSRPI